MAQAAAKQHFSYSDSPVAIREDLAEANRSAWARIARPGAWWSGAERVAIAAEVRNAASCALCKARKDAVSPNAVKGDHDSNGELPAAAVDVIHRVVTDQARLSKDWFDATLASGLSQGHYVEIIGVLVSIVSIDSFHRAAGLPPEELPESQPGDPSSYRPEGAVEGEAWVPMLVPGRVSAAEADLFDAPRAPNVLRAMSLVPDAVRGLRELSTAYYVGLVDVPDPAATGNRAISRQQMELVAGRVSALNECFY